jgi:hypothetical protein
LEPAVITFRPDNFLTIGLIGAVVYVAALVLVQLAGRAGLVKLSSPGAAVPAGTVATA